jgi:hypothetical protein
MFLVLSSGFARAAGGDQQHYAEISKQILLGIDAYKSRGAEGTWECWNEFADYPEQGTHGRIGFIQAVTQAETMYGKMEGLDLIRMDLWGSSFCKLYYVWIFEKRPVFIEFSCYKPEDKWEIIAYGLTYKDSEVPRN